MLGNQGAALREAPRPGACRKLSGKQGPADRDGLFQAAAGPRPLGLWSYWQVRWSEWAFARVRIPTKARGRADRFMGRRQWCGLA